MPSCISSSQSSTLDISSANPNWAAMSLAFCTFGIGAMILAQVIARRLSTRSGPLGPRGLWLIRVALFAAGLFPPIPTRSVVAYVHGLSGLVVILASPIVFMNWHSRGILASCGGRSLWRGSAWSRSGAPRLSSPADPTMGLDPAIGTSNRLMITTYCLWFAVAERGAPHHRGVFPTRWLSHGAPFPVRGWVTPVLRKPLPVR